MVRIIALLVFTRLIYFIREFLRFVVFINKKSDERNKRSNKIRT